MDSKNILGVPYYSGDSLVQDVILLYLEKTVNDQGEVIQTKRVKETSSNVILLNNIWDSLKSGNTITLDITGGDYEVTVKSCGPKSSSKKSWYFKVKYTDPNPESTSGVAYFDLPIPTPKPEVFGFNFEEDGGDSDWSKYWKQQMKQTEQSNYNGINALLNEKVEMRNARNTQKMELQYEGGELSGAEYTENDPEEVIETFRRSGISDSEDAENIEIPKTKYVDYQKADGTFSGEVVPVETEFNYEISEDLSNKSMKPIDSGLWEKENPYTTLGGLMASFW